MGKVKEFFQGIAIVWATHEPRTQWGMRRLERRTRRNAGKVAEIIESAMRNAVNVAKGK